MLIPCMHPEDGLPCGHVRMAYGDLSVEPSRPHDGRIQYVHPVGGRHHYDALICLKSVHLHQHLVKGLLPLVMGTSKARASASCHRVYLIYEYDAWSVFLGLGEHIPDSGCSDSDKHLYKVRSGNAVERHLGLSRYRLGKQSLSGSRRAYQYNALGDTGSHLVKGPRILKELYDLLYLILFLHHSGHVRQRDIHISRKPCPAFGKLVHPGSLSAGGRAHHPYEHHHYHKRNDRRDDRRYDKIRAAAYAGPVVYILFL